MGWGRDKCADLWRQQSAPTGRLALGKSSTFSTYTLVCFLIGKMEMKVPPSKGCCGPVVKIEAKLLEVYLVS